MDPITFEIFPEQGFYISRWVGRVDDEAMARAYRRLFEIEAWRPGLDEVVDAREADVRLVSAEGVRTLSKIIESHLVSLEAEDVSFRTAAVFGNDLGFGLARLYEMVSVDSPETVRVFREMAAAREWLGLSPESHD